VYEIIQHTADVRMRVVATSLAELFAESVRGLMEVIRPEVASNEETLLRIDVAAPDVTTLLVDFLNEVLTRTHIARETYDQAAIEQIDETHVVATLRGRVAEGFEEDVKAVTYHEADVRHEDSTWSTLLVFDI
jgi:SHS2 domain-containing protein